MTTTKQIDNAIKEQGAALASVCAGIGAASIFRPHWVDSETGLHGVRWLIARILTEAGAVHPKFDGAFREVYTRTSMTTADIIAKVREANGFNRYPDKTILDVLSTVMTQDEQVGSIQLTGAEDAGRTCRRPRKVWYLIQK